MTMPTESEIVEWLDPDWRDHYADIESAACLYYAPSSESTPAARPVAEADDQTEIEA